jgi:Chromo (CHRromatin Organisation MOdifier) domain
MIADDGTPLYLVGALLKDRQVHRKGGNMMQYLVKWKGYGLDEATWEDESSLSHLDVLKSTSSVPRGTSEEIWLLLTGQRSLSVSALLLLLRKLKQSSCMALQYARSLQMAKTSSGTLEFVESTFDPCELEDIISEWSIQIPLKKKRRFHWLQLNSYWEIWRACHPPLPKDAP